jgi:hypothetical protein
MSTQSNHQVLDNPFKVHPKRQPTLWQRIKVRLGWGLDNTPAYVLHSMTLAKQSKMIKKLLKTRGNHSSIILPFEIVPELAGQYWEIGYDVEINTKKRVTKLSW